MSGAIAGLISKFDARPGGLAVSPINKPLTGITGLSEALPIPFNPSSTSLYSQLLSYGADNLGRTMFVTSRRSGIRTVGGRLGGTGVFDHIVPRRVVDLVKRRLDIVSDDFTLTTTRRTRRNINKLSTLIQSELNGIRDAGLLDGGFCCY